MKPISESTLPGAKLNTANMPGHWLLARLGKRVLRPGGLELTESMLQALKVSDIDDVVEFAPGLGVTTKMVLKLNPASFTAIERDPNAAAHVARHFDRPTHRCVNGRAEDSGLKDQVASVVYGEAMLSMQTANGKRRIVREAHRLLRPGGRYGIHELALTPDDLDPQVKNQIETELSDVIHIGARPLTPSEWAEILTTEGFRVVSVQTNPMHLLEPMRMVRDEGVEGVLRIAFSLAKDPIARRRVLEMHGTFKRWENQLCAISMVAERL